MILLPAIVSILAGIGLVTVLVAIYILWRCSMDYNSLLYVVFKAFLSKTSFSEFVEEYGDALKEDVMKWIETT